MLSEGQVWGGDLSNHGRSFSSCSFGMAVVRQDVGQAQNTIHLQMEKGHILCILGEDHRIGMRQRIKGPDLGQSGSLSTLGASALAPAEIGDLP